MKGSLEAGEKKKMPDAPSSSCKKFSVYEALDLHIRATERSFQLQAPVVY